ncbi:hypothetical protein GZH53_17480 [Flavihumibacter sp. R14]|nr:hypothetical protein [Flavihumibacter soli]
MKRENLYYAIFALLVIIFCAVTAMRVFANTLPVTKPKKKKHSSVRINNEPDYSITTRQMIC